MRVAGSLQRVISALVLGMLLISCGDLHAKGKRRRKRRAARTAVLRATAKSEVPLFSKSYHKTYTDDEIGRLNGKPVVWTVSDTLPFGELLPSWNALRPEQGYLLISTSVKFNGKWTKWQNFAKWGRGALGRPLQKTFLNKTSSLVHTKHSRVEMQRRLGRGFKIRVHFCKGASPTCLKKLGANIARLKNQKIILPEVSKLASVYVKRGITGISQFMLNHAQKNSICSPVSTSMVVGYYHSELYGKKPHHSMARYATDFTHKVHDQALGIFGNWPLNTAEAFHATNGEVYFSVQRLNSFYDLHHHLMQRTPVIVSVRRLKGGATPYANGHLLVVIGWNAKKQRVICLDPAFSSHQETLKSYPLRAFLNAWGRSNNLSYVPTRKHALVAAAAPVPNLDVDRYARHEQPDVQKGLQVELPDLESVRLLPPMLVDQII